MSLVKNNNGFSLMEVMIVMLVMTIVSLNMITLNKNEFGAALRIQAANDMNAIVNEIGSMLADPAVCLAYLGPTNFPTGPACGETQVNNSTHVTTYATCASPDVLPFTSAPKKFTAAPFDVPNNGRNYTLAPQIGNSHIAIHSFVFQDWRRPLDPLTQLLTIEGVSTAILTVNFFRKTRSSWSWNNSMWTGKNIKLSVTTNAAGQITRCQSQNYPHSSTGNGPRSCPVVEYGAPSLGMTMVGTPGANGSFCISTALRGPMAYKDAMQECSSNGAHLCTFGEWNKSCLLKTGATPPSILSPVVFGASTTSWEWVASSPTSTAIGGGTPVASKVLKVGANLGTGNVCLTANVDVNPSPPSGSDPNVITCNATPVNQFDPAVSSITYCGQNNGYVNDPGLPGYIPPTDPAYPGADYTSTQCNTDMQTLASTAYPSVSAGVAAGTYTTIGTTSTIGTILYYARQAELSNGYNFLSTTLRAYWANKMLNKSLQKQACNIVAAASGTNYRCCISR